MTMISLSDLTVQRLRYVTQSAGINLEDASKKEEIIDVLADEELRLTENGWIHGDEEYELHHQVANP